MIRLTDKQLNLVKRAAVLLRPSACSILRLMASGPCDDKAITATINLVFSKKEKTDA
jgi:hypothetical protein